MKNIFYTQNRFNKTNCSCSSFSSKKQNIINSLEEVEHFLCTLDDFFKYVKLYRLLK